MGIGSTQAPSAPQPSAGGGWKPEQKLGLYEKVFDFWTKTRDERTDYNKYFITLLFGDTLVAILGSALGFTTTTNATNLAVVLLIATFVGAFVISLVWWLKLSTLRLLAGFQLEILKEMENSFEMPCHAIQRFDEQTLDKIRKDHKGTFKNRAMISLNYDLLPKFFALLYFVLILVLLVFGKSLFAAF